MKRLITVGFCLLLLMIFPVNAQETGHQLREVSIDDYLAFLETSAQESDTFNRTIYNATPDTLNILDLSLLESDFDTLKRTYDALFQNARIFMSHTDWHNALLATAFREKRITLSDSGNIFFDDYQIEVTAVDFDNDSIDEYLLKVLYTPSGATASYEAYHLVSISPEGEYRVISTSLGANISDLSFGWTGHITAYPPRDINADGQLEWIVTQLGDNIGPGGWSRGFLRIFSLRDGQLVNIAPDDFGFNNAFIDDIQWDWDDYDGDGIVEFEQSYQHSNNWGCHYQTIHRLDWSDDTRTYDYVSELDDFPQTFGCLITKAEEAMWASDYESAVQSYEEAFATELPDPSDYEATGKIQYAQIRLMLAYAMQGQNEEAQTLLSGLKLQSPGSEEIGELITILSELNLSETENFDVCRTMHDYFVKSYNYIGIVVGMTLVDNELFDFYHSYPSPANPLRAGCDLNHLVAERLGDIPIPVTESPVDRFTLSGIAINESLNVDFNGDGILDWLIFPDLLIDPYLFLSSEIDDFYHLFHPNFFVGEDVEVRMTSLSDKVQIHYLSNDVLITFNGTPLCPVNYQVWQFNDNQLISIFHTDLCESLSLDEIIQADGYELHVPLGVSGAYFGNCSADNTPMIYTWNGERYASSDACFDDYDYDYDERPYLLNQQLQQLRNALLNNEDVTIFADTLASTLSGDLSWVTEETVLQAHYFYALALEKLERPVDAIEQYLILIQLAPDSSWALLSALRLEPAD